MSQVGGVVDNNNNIMYCIYISSFCLCMFLQQQIVGILLAMAMHQLPREEMYWRSGKYGLIQYPDFGKVTGITERRFKEIMSALQFIDKGKVTPQIKLQH